jgi:hypothetical protein
LRVIPVFSHIDQLKRIVCMSQYVNISYAIFQILVKIDIRGLYVRLLGYLYLNHID